MVQALVCCIIGNATSNHVRPRQAKTIAPKRYPFGAPVLRVPIHAGPTEDVAGPAPGASLVSARWSWVPVKGSSVTCHERQHQGYDGPQRREALRQPGQQWQSQCPGPTTLSQERSGQDQQREVVAPHRRRQQHRCGDRDHEADLGVPPPACHDRCDGDQPGEDQCGPGQLVRRAQTRLLRRGHVDSARGQSVP